jgi:aspartate carbamoyltransferase catalytic subunit
MQVTAHEHPTQGLLDSYSIREKLGEVGGKKVVIVGDVFTLESSIINIYALQMQGAEKLSLRTQNANSKIY